MSRLVLLSLALLTAALPAGVAVSDQPSDKAAVKCPVSGAAVSQDASADYKGARVYFCCNGCAGKFQKAPEKYATKANHQLAASGQFTQKGCPISGGPTDASTGIPVEGVTVVFCCNGCKGKVAKLDSAEQLEMVFSDKTFSKAFQAK